MRRWLTLAALFAVVLGLGWVQANRPRVAALPVVYTVQGDSEVEAAGVTARLLEALHVEKLLSDSYDAEGEILPTKGTWVVATVEIGATREPTLGVVFELVDRHGRTFTTTSRAGSMSYRLQPGEVVTLQMAFEVPLDALPDGVDEGRDPGLTLRMYPEGINYYTVGIPMEVGAIQIDSLKPWSSTMLEEALGPRVAS